MNSNQRIDEFLKLQDKGISLDEIASTLGIKSQTLRRDLNKNGYKSVKGKYIKKDEINTSEQVSFKDSSLLNNNDVKVVENKINKATQKTTRKNNKVAEKIETLNKEGDKKRDIKIEDNKTKKSKIKIAKEIKANNKNLKQTKPKKDRKINLTQDDLDKLCEVYDWYLEVKDLKSLKPKKIKKSLNIDFEKTEDKTVSIKVDKSVWEDFLRLCSNTSYDRKTVITQALSDFMKNHKELL